MRATISFSKVFVVLYLLLISSFLNAEVADTSDNEMAASAIAAKSWIELVDKGKYAESWDASSSLLKRTMSKAEWVRVLEATRKPLGNASSRTIIDQRPAPNPKGLPPGDYMVVLYSTVFDTKPKGKELITMEQGDDGQWRVMTYLVD